MEARHGLVAAGTHRWLQLNAGNPRAIPKTPQVDRYDFCGPPPRRTRAGETATSHEIDGSNTGLLSKRTSLSRPCLVRLTQCSNTTQDVATYLLHRSDKRQTEPLGLCPRSTASTMDKSLCRPSSVEMDDVFDGRDVQPARGYVGGLQSTGKKTVVTVVAHQIYQVRVRPGPTRPNRRL